MYTQSEFLTRNDNKLKLGYFKESNYGISDGKVGKYKAYWVMLSKNVLHGTRYKTFEIQKQLVEQKKFEIPNLIGTVVSLLMHKMRTDEFIYPDDSSGHQWTFTCVQEQSINGYRIMVGGFSALGLNVCNYHYSYVTGGIGAAWLR